MNEKVKNLEGVCPQGGWKEYPVRRQERGRKDATEEDTHLEAKDRRNFLR